MLNLEVTLSDRTFIENEIHHIVHIPINILEKNVRDEWRNAPQYAFRPTHAPARLAELLAHAQNTTMCLKHIFEFFGIRA